LENDLLIATLWSKTTALCDLRKKGGELYNSSLSEKEIIQKIIG